MGKEEGLHTDSRCERVKQMWQLREKTSTIMKDQGEMSTRASTETVYHCPTFKNMLETLSWCRSFHDKQERTLEVTYEIWEETDGN